MKQVYQGGRNGPSGKANRLQASSARRPVGPADHQPLREQLRRRRPSAERDQERACGPRTGQRPGLSPERAEARGADRDQLDAAARALFRQAGRPRWRSRRPPRRGDRPRLRFARPLADGVHGNGPRARRRIGLGPAQPLAARRHAMQRLGRRPYARPGRRHADPGARHVRARLSSRLRHQRVGLCRCLHGQSPLAPPPGALHRRRVSADIPHDRHAGGAPSARLADDAASVPVRLQGARRAPPDRIEAVAAGLARNSKAIVYCAWGFEIGGDCAARLRAHGIDAVAIAGGLGAWRADGLPTEPFKEGEAT